MEFHLFEDRGCHRRRRCSTTRTSSTPRRSSGWRGTTSPSCRARRPARSARLSELPLRQDVERRQACAGVERHGPDHRREAGVAAAFERQAARRPEADAVVLGSERLSYGELNRRANQLARHLTASRRRPRGPGGDLRGAVRWRWSWASGDPQGGWGLRAARPELPAGAPGLHGGGLRGPGSADPGAPACAGLPGGRFHVLCLDRDWAEVASRGGCEPRGRRSAWTTWPT